MKRRGRLILLTATILSALVIAPLTTSCGSLHSYWGVENDYYTDFDGHHHKPPKHKKHKKPKHRRHHHDDD